MNDICIIMALFVVCGGVLFVFLWFVFVVCLWFVRGCGVCVFVVCGGLWCLCFCGECS